MDNSPEPPKLKPDVGSSRCVLRDNKYCFYFKYSSSELCTPYCVLVSTVQCTQYSYTILVQVIIRTNAHPNASDDMSGRTLRAELLDEFVARGGVAHVHRRERSLATRRVDPLGVLPLRTWGIAAVGSRGACERQVMVRVFRKSA